MPAFIRAESRARCNANRYWIFGSGIYRRNQYGAEGIRSFNTSNEAGWILIGCSDIGSDRSITKSPIAAARSDKLAADLIQVMQDQ
jgi:hypothetical protein